MLSQWHKLAVAFIALFGLSSWAGSSDQAANIKFCHARGQTAEVIGEMRDAPDVSISRTKKLFGIALQGEVDKAKKAGMPAVLLRRKKDSQFQSALEIFIMIEEIWKRPKLSPEQLKNRYFLACMRVFMKEEKEDEADWGDGSGESRERYRRMVS